MKANWEPLKSSDVLPVQLQGGCLGPYSWWLRKTCIKSVNLRKSCKKFPFLTNITYEKHRKYFSLICLIKTAKAYKVFPWQTVWFLYPKAVVLHVISCSKDLHTFPLFSFIDLCNLPWTCAFMRCLHFVWLIYMFQKTKSTKQFNISMFLI